MDFKTAMQKAQLEAGGRECVEALDMGEFWAFAFTEKGEMVGGGYIAVDKNGGGMTSFNPTQNFDLFRKAKLINI